MNAADWWQRGSTVQVQIGGRGRRVFYRAEGSGPPLTLLHGFPTSSLDWAPMWDALTAHHRVIAVDFLGYGRSEKPSRHTYDLDEQVELVLGIWKHLNVTETAVVAYDYGAIVAQLLLAHHGGRLTRVILMNAGLIADHYRPRPIQRLAQIPIVGALAFRLLDERRYTRTWSEVFSPSHPLSVELAHQHWLAMSESAPAGDTERRLLRYIQERKRRAAELDAAFSTTVPLSFVWGLADPVSGTVAPALAQRWPDADLVTYDDVGHYPHLEVPDRVSADILDRTTTPPSNSARIAPGADEN